MKIILSAVTITMFHPFKLHLSPAQIRKLTKGFRVLVAHKNIGQGNTYHLTKRQLNKVKSNQKKQMGVKIQFDAHQIRHHQKGGYLPNLGDLLSLAKPLAKTGIKWGLKKGVDYGLSKVSDKYNFAKPAAKKAADFLIDTAADLVGSGLRRRIGVVKLGRGRRHRSHRRRGGSFAAFG